MGVKMKAIRTTNNCGAVLARVSSIEITIACRIYEDLGMHILLRNKPPHGNSILRSNSISRRPDTLGLCKISSILRMGSGKADSSSALKALLGVDMWYPWKPSTGALGTFVDLLRQGGAYPS